MTQTKAQANTEGRVVAITELFRDLSDGKYNENSSKARDIFIYSPAMFDGDAPSHAEFSNNFACNKRITIKTFEFISFHIQSIILNFFFITRWKGSFQFSSELSAKII